MEKEKPVSVGEALIDATVKLIEERGGIRGVTLRDIAREAGCKHTNVYNYHESFEGLLWAAMSKAFALLMGYTEKKMARFGEEEPSMRRFAAAQIDFALEHPGLFRFIWLEPLSGNPPPEIIDKLLEPYAMLLDFVGICLGEGFSRPEIERASDILYGYLHGEICNLVNGRFLTKSPDQYRSDILNNMDAIENGLKEKRV